MLISRRADLLVHGDDRVPGYTLGEELLSFLDAPSIKHCSAVSCALLKLARRIVLSKRRDLTWGLAGGGPPLLCVNEVDGEAWPDYHHISSTRIPPGFRNCVVETAGCRCSRVSDNANTEGATRCCDEAACPCFERARRASPDGQ